MLDGSAEKDYCSKVPQPQQVFFATSTAIERNSYEQSTVSVTVRNMEGVKKTGFRFISAAHCLNVDGRALCGCVA